MSTAKLPAENLRTKACSSLLTAVWRKRSVSHSLTLLNNVRESTYRPPQRASSREKTTRKSTSLNRRIAVALEWLPMRVNLTTLNCFSSLDLIDEACDSACWISDSNGCIRFNSVANEFETTIIMNAVLGDTMLPDRTKPTSRRITIVHSENA